jgi:hypothetical protein
MRNAVAALLAAMALGTIPAWAQGMLGAEELCAQYLSAREELAPVTLLCGGELNARLEELRGRKVELVGSIAGMARCSESQDQQGAARLLTLALDDGVSVCLSAGEDVDGLRIGESVCVIAEVSATAPGPGDLKVARWVREWDLPEQERLHRPPTPETAAVQGTGSSGQGQRTPVGSGRHPGRRPGSVTQETPQLSQAEVWQRWVLGNNARLTQDQAQSIAEWVLHYSKQFKVNHRLVFAVIKWESDCHPECVSHAGAIGLMQLMPGTARYLGVDPWNVQQNIKGGVRYLSEQLADYRGRSNYEQCALALAAYNAGPNAVKRAGGVPAIPETQRYVRKVTETFYQLWKAEFP